MYHCIVLTSRTEAVLASILLFGLVCLCVFFLFRKVDCKTAVRLVFQMFLCILAPLDDVVASRFPYVSTYVNWFA